MGDDYFSLFCRKYDIKFLGYVFAGLTAKYFSLLATSGHYSSFRDPHSWNIYVMSSLSFLGIKQCRLVSNSTARHLN